MPKSPTKKSFIFRDVAKAFSTNMAGAVTKVFDRLRTRLLGNPVGKGKKLVFSPKYTLEGLFRAASGINPDEELLRHIKLVTSNYLDAEEAKTKAGIAHAVGSWVATNPDTSVEIVLGGELASIMGKAISNVSRIVNTELNNAKNFGTLDYITRVSSSIGVEDPVVYWVCIHDDKLCSECKRLHLLEDELTPRVWKLSEVKSGYAKKGDDRPSISDQHPNGRCHMETLPPGYGFKGGSVSYIGADHDEFAKQRA